ncbi:unnamed protein product [Medioppia subpectinata]|uniref:Uncharacterized protein n=1 Tax=Medioppia subpectinata TaxID=1979941 RepID=A0A7R9KD83_9ACAR|nr:unnamed protein product [Medioppia subpectinata]CAG2101094.1 unnamed protein product [Medioppia subpectinata]
MKTKSPPNESLLECNTDYFHKEWRDDDPHGSYCTSKYLYGAPPTKAGVDFNNSAINRLDLGNKTHTSTYEPTNYGRSSDPFERFDEYFDKSYNNPDFDDSIREHSNSYYNTTERQFLAPTKRVHYSGGNDSVSSGSISGRSDTPYDHYASPFDTSLSPDPNAYSSHPYRNDAPLILHEAVGPPFRHLDLTALMTRFCYCNAQMSQCNQYFTSNPHGPNSSYRTRDSLSSRLNPPAFGVKHG